MAVAPHYVACIQRGYPFVRVGAVMTTLTTSLLVLLVAKSYADTTTTANPVATAAPGQFLGYRNSTNTQSLRDLGFMGKLGQFISGELLI